MIPTDLEITLEFLDSPTEVDFFAVAGAPGHDGQDGADGRDGADGHTPVITASKQGKVTTISVDGSAVAQILDGADGQPGQDGQDGSPGQDGADGHSPVVTASKSGKVTTVSVDGEPIATINDGNDGQDGQDGSDGQDGFSPSASISKSGSTATITVTDKNGTTTATVSDGQAGADGHSPVITTTKSGKVTTILSDGQSIGTVEDGADGTTPDLSNYVQKTDYASASQLGIVGIDTGYGIQLTGSSHKLCTNPPTSAQIKEGTQTWRPLVASRQHESTFYGLAKAAGDSTQSASSNTVGSYTDAAKDKILQMLGIDGLIAQHEGAQSTHAYAANDVFIYAGKLYKATTAIAINDAIAPNVNCVQTTLVNLIRGI